MKRKSLNMFEPSSSRRRSRRGLRFSEYSCLILTEPKSTEEVQSVWYTKKDMEQFKRLALVEAQALRNTRTAQVIKSIAHSAAAGSPKADVQVHNKERIRGIEHLMDADVLRFLVRKRARHRESVLRVQQALKDAGVTTTTSASETAKVSEINSAFSKEWCTQLTHFQQA